MYLHKKIVCFESHRWSWVFCDYQQIGWRNYNFFYFTRLSGDNLALHFTLNWHGRKKNSRMFSCVCGLFSWPALPILHLTASLLAAPSCFFSLFILSLYLLSISMLPSIDDASRTHRMITILLFAFSYCLSKWYFKTWPGERVEQKSIAPVFLPTGSVRNIKFVWRIKMDILFIN